MNRLLVVLPNWYGETLFVTPFLRALRQQRPDAFIATLGRPACREILLHDPHVDERLVFEAPGAPRGLRGIWSVLRRLRAQRFDTGFVLRRSLSRTCLLAAAGIPRRVGLANPKSGWLLTHRATASRLPRHKAMAALPLLSAVGLESDAGPYEYTVSEDERRDARRWLRTDGLLGGEGPLVVLHPGANWAHKRWPAERFGLVGARLREEAGVRIAITGGPDDVELAGVVARAIPPPVAVLAGRTTLRQLGALLELTDVLVSNDTGVLHLAAALRRPVVALYGPTSPALTGPLGDPDRIRVIHRPEGCPVVPCNHPAPSSHPGMAAIDVEEVLEAARQLLALGRVP